ncbi:hypothetical protein ACFLVZ_00080 [Chloroflexota bacterium]
MKKLLKRLLSGEKGQALPIVLGLLAIGGLTIATSVNYASTSLRSSGIVQENVKGIYAAGAGMGYAIWNLREGITTANQTPEDINQMAVSILTEDMGTYTVYLDELVEPEPGTHTDWVSISSNITLVGGTTSNYTISVVRAEEASGNIRLVEIGAVLPQDYTFVTDSPAGFPENLSTDNPTSTGNTSNGAVWVKWLWNPGQGPLITGNHTQEFYIDGTENTDDAYAWIIAQSNDVGTVGEITGTLYRITSTATRPGDGAVTARIEADVIIRGRSLYVFSWDIQK